VLLIIQRYLDKPAIEAWGWRIPFVIGALCAVVAIWLRRSMEETSDFEKDRASRPQTSAAATIRGLMEHPRAVLTVVGLTAGGTVAFYTFTTYAQKFLVNTVGFTAQQATFINAVTLLVYLCLQPIVGAISDVVGRRPVLTAFGIAGSLGTIPLFRALESTQSVSGAIWLLLAALTAVSGYTAINAVVKAELFPTSIRALGVGFPYAVTVALFGGTAEYIALYFKNIGRESWFYYYVTGCIVCSLLVYATMRESSKLGHMSE
jgi:MHS family alpha-ketoglutarate permease-like MFS transporter